jgi:hypothetical protein
MYSFNSLLPTPTVLPILITIARNRVYTFPRLLAHSHQESILASESEWTQHKKLIDFSSRPGGFRRSLVSNMPYFMVQWDYKGEKGYGHIIEGVDDAIDKEEGEGEGGTSGGLAEGGSGGAFPE